MEKQAVLTRSTHITGARKHSDAEQHFTDPRGFHWKSHDQMYRTIQLLSELPLPIQILTLGIHAHSDHQ